MSENFQVTVNDASEGRTAEAVTENAPVLEVEQVEEVAEKELTNADKA